MKDKHFRLRYIFFITTLQNFYELYGVLFEFTNKIRLYLKIKKKITKVR